MAKLLTDEYATKIVIGTLNEPKSAIQLSKELGIPIAACYRRIRHLEKAGLLKCRKKVLTKKGKRVALYASQLKNAHIFFEDGKVKVKVEFLNGITKDFITNSQNSVR
jgi:predicted transcriptional regulator